MNSRGTSKSGLFLIELVIVILFFSVSATICMRIFAVSYSAAGLSRDLGEAVSAAVATAECFKASGGDLSLTARTLGDGEISDCTYVRELDGGLTLLLESETEGRLIRGRITVSDGDEDIYSLDACAIAGLSNGEGGQ